MSKPENDSHVARWAQIEADGVFFNCIEDLGGEAILAKTLNLALRRAEQKLEWCKLFGKYEAYDVPKLFERFVDFLRFVANNSAISWDEVFHYDLNSFDDECKAHRYRTCIITAAESSLPAASCSPCSHFITHGFWRTKHRDGHQTCPTSDVRDPQAKERIESLEAQVNNLRDGLNAHGIHWGDREYNHPNTSDNRAWVTDELVKQINAAWLTCLHKLELPPETPIKPVVSIDALTGRVIVAAFTSFYGQSEFNALHPDLDHAESFSLLLRMTPFRDEVAKRMMQTLYVDVPFVERGNRIK